MSTIASSPSYRFLPAVWKLIRLRLLISLNGFKHAKTIRKILTIVAVLGLLAFAGMILFLSWILLDFLRSPQLTQYVGMDVTPFLQAMPVIDFHWPVRGHPAEQFWCAPASLVSFRRHGLPVEFAGAHPGGVCHQAPAGGAAQLWADFPVRSAGVVRAGSRRALQPFSTIHLSC